MFEQIAPLEHAPHLAVETEQYTSPTQFAFDMNRILKESGNRQFVHSGWYIRFPLSRQAWYWFQHKPRVSVPSITANISFGVPHQQPPQLNLVPLVSSPTQSGVQTMFQLRDDAQTIVSTSNFRDAKGGPVTPKSFAYGVSDSAVLGLSDVSADGQTATVVGVGTAGQTAQLQRSGVNEDGSPFNLAPIDIQLTGGEVASADSAFGEQTPQPAA